jgi:hypothetical protein
MFPLIYYILYSLILFDPYFIFLSWKSSDCVHGFFSQIQKIQELKYLKFCTGFVAYSFIENAKIPKDPREEAIHFFEII